MDKAKIYLNKEFHHYINTKKVDINNLELVAEVKVANLDMVYELTQNINQPWTENKDVINLGNKKKYRSLSVGDIVVYNEEQHVVEMLGFKKLKLNI